MNIEAMLNELTAGLVIEAIDPDEIDFEEEFDHAEAEEEFEEGWGDDV